MSCHFPAMYVFRQEIKQSKYLNDMSIDTILDVGMRFPLIYCYFVVSVAHYT